MKVVRLQSAPLVSQQEDILKHFAQIEHSELQIIAVNLPRRRLCETVLDLQPQYLEIGAVSVDRWARCYAAWRDVGIVVILPAFDRRGIPIGYDFVVRVFRRGKQWVVVPASANRF